MRSRFAVNLLLVFVAAGSAIGQDEDQAERALSPDDVDRIERLIRSLGDDEFTVREASSKALAEFGAAAHPLLKKFADDEDPEVAVRVKRLLSPNAPPGAEAALVEKFLNAVREGDAKCAESCLTRKAAAEMQKAEMHVMPPGSPRATFAIGEAKTINMESVHVTSMWTDEVEGGEKKTYEITWILRSEARGWGVAGMKTSLFPDSPELVLNFEDPADMVAQVQKANAKFAEAAGEIHRAPAPPK